MGEAECVAELRRRVDIPPHYGTEWNLRRWGVAWDWVLGEMEPRLRRTLAFRDALHLHTVPRLPSDDYTAWARTHFNPIATDYYPGGYSGYDLKGNLLLIEPLGRCDPKGLLPTGRCSEFYRARMAEVERALRLVMAQEAKIGRKVGLFYVMDLEGLTMEQLAIPTMQIYMDLIRMLQDNFPDLLTKLLIIKAPTIMQIAYNMVAPILAKQTREKLEIVGKDWQRVLLSQVEPSQLPVYWGGTQTGPGESPYGSIRMGGPVPASLAYDPAANPLEPSNAHQSLTSLTLPRGSKKEVGIVVEAGGSSVSWFFRSPSGDIYFSVSDKESGAELVPRMRLNTDHVPEFDSLPLPAPTTLIFTFDNTHSYIRSKPIQYYIYINPPSPP